MKGKINIQKRGDMLATPELAIRREKDIPQTWAKPESRCGLTFFPFPFPLSKLTEYVWIPGNREKVEFHHKPSLSWGWFWDGCQTAVLPPLQRRQCLTPEYRWFAEPSLYMVVMQGGRGLLGRYSTFQGRSMKKKEEKKQKKKLFGKQQ